MREHGHTLAVEEIEHAVIDPLEANAKLIDSISKDVRLGPSKLMAKVFEPLEPREALVLCLGRQPIKPGE